MPQISTRAYLICFMNYVKSFHEIPVFVSWLTLAWSDRPGQTIRMGHGYAIHWVKIRHIFRGLKPTATIFDSGLRPWWFQIYNALLMVFIVIKNNGP